MRHGEVGGGGPMAHPRLAASCWSLAASSALACSLSLEPLLLLLGLGRLAALVWTPLAGAEAAVLAALLLSAGASSVWEELSAGASGLEDSGSGSAASLDWLLLSGVALALSSAGGGGVVSGGGTAPPWHPARARAAASRTARTAARGLPLDIVFIKCLPFPFCQIPAESPCGSLLPGRRRRRFLRLVSAAFLPQGNKKVAQGTEKKPYTCATKQYNTQKAISAFPLALVFTGEKRYNGGCNVRRKAVVYGGVSP